MAGFLVGHGKKLKSRLPFYRGGEKRFCRRATCAFDTLFNFRALNRKAIAEAGLRMLLSATGTRFAFGG